MTHAAPVSVRDIIDGRAGTSPKEPFLIDPASGRTVSYADLRKMARAVSAAIAARGVGPGESVAYALGNSIDAAAAVLGIIYGGYRATAINMVAGDETIAYVLEHSGAKLVLTGPESSPGGANAPPDPPVDDALFETGAAADALPPLTGDTDALLMYTSGTTGRPKGVVLSHGNLIAGGRNAADAHLLGPQDRALCVLPLYHINGLCVTLMGPLVSGGSVVMPAKFSVSGFWETIKTTGCSWFSVVPTQISYLLHDEQPRGTTAADCTDLRFGRSASAPLAPEAHEAFEQRFGIPVIETMGLTETAAQILSNPLPPGTRKIGSPGIAFGNEIMIGDDAQREAPRGTEGEVLVRGPNVMRCYLNDEAATAQAITPEGWLRTGDLGRMDADGYVFITGRLKELIIKGGENIAPREVDEALCCHPDVIEAAAFPRPCRDYGQRVEAGVVLISGSTATEGDLIEVCRTRIGPFKAPDRVHLMQHLPKGPSGKIQRIKLAELVDGRP